MKPMPLRWSHVSCRAGEDLKILKVRHDRMRGPKGAPEVERLRLESVDWVNCVARTSQGQFVMVEQHRFGVHEVTLEPAGGMVDPGETPLEAMQRELQEETGYGGGVWVELGSVQPNPAFLDNRCHLFFADGVEKIYETSPTPYEVIRTHVMDFAEIQEAVQQERFLHSLGLLAFSRVSDICGKL